MTTDNTLKLDPALRDRVREWIAVDPDAETRQEAETLLHAAAAGDRSAAIELRSAFTGRLSFGTAGLRAKLGAGPARMNRVVVAQTSAGFAEFLLQRAARGDAASPPTVVIGYDGRVNSHLFARDTAEIMAGAGLNVTLLPEAMPTPVTAFAVRHLHASAGVMITASHNPPLDNGYKVYLGDADGGSQIISPSDREITALIDQAASRPYPSLPRSRRYTLAGGEVRQAYVRAVVAAVRGPQQRHADSPSLRIAYTAMHGVGADLTREVFAAAQLPEPVTTPEQDRPDGSFPTVAFPNPEEPGALELAFRTARSIDAELVIAHDPDADRLAVALPDPGTEGGYRRLSGNEIGILLGWHAARREHRRAEHAGGTPSGTLACSNVSSPALRVIAEAYGLDYAETLPGFKWVSRVPNLIFGFEEAIGYLTHPDVVRDKDGVLASAEFVTLALECEAAGGSLAEMLDQAAMRFGYFASTQVTVRLDSAHEVALLAEWVRHHPPHTLGSVAVAQVHDLLTPGLAAEPSNVLSYELADGSRVMIRPSGTEPKLKVYIDTVAATGSLAERQTQAHQSLNALESALHEYLNQAE